MPSQSVLFSSTKSPARTVTPSSTFRSFISTPLSGRKAMLTSGSTAGVAVLAHYAYWLRRALPPVSVPWPRQSTISSTPESCNDTLAILFEWVHAFNFTSPACPPTSSKRLSTGARMLFRCTCVTLARWHPSAMRLSMPGILMARVR